MDSLPGNNIVALALFSLVLSLKVAIQGHEESGFD